MRLDLTITMAILIAATALPGCFGQIEPEPLRDEDGDIIPLPGPYEDWLRVTEVSPPPKENARLARRPAFAVTFNQYLDDDSFKSYQSGSLASNGLRVSGQQTYIMSTKTLLWQARSDLRPGFEYTFSFDLSALRSVTDSPRLPEDQVSRTYIAVDEGASDEDGLTYTLEMDTAPVTWGEVEALFTSKQCYTCHGQDNWPRLTSLSREQLVGYPSSQRDLFLVRPADPTDSYLMHKLLPDYPIREGTVQPPPWSDTTTPLTIDELWLVERWIRGGAK